MTLEASERTNGIVVGRLYACDEKMRDEFAQMVKDQCDGTIFPILLNVDVEYTDPILTIPPNAMVGLDSEKDEFTTWKLECCM